MGTTLEDFLADSEEGIIANAEQNMIFQAIAEDMNLEITEDDIKAYFLENVGSEDYAAIEATYGIGYIKMGVYLEHVIDHLMDNVVRAEQ